MSNIIDTGTVAAPRSAVAWPAIFAGSVTGAAVSVILVLLGAGFGLAAVSPWGGNFSPTTFGVSAAIWLIVIEWVSAAFAGYFAGRLRTRMTGFHTDEVFFRDTAHGFVSWSFSLIILTAIFASSLAGIVGKRRRTGRGFRGGRRHVRHVRKLRSERLPDGPPFPCRARRRDGGRRGSGTCRDRGRSSKRTGAGSDGRHERHGSRRHNRGSHRHDHGSGSG
jgi:hypothetical protein